MEESKFGLSSVNNDALYGEGKANIVLSNLFMSPNFNRLNNYGY